MLCNVMPMKRIREQKVSAHLLFFFFKLSIWFGLDFEFRLRLMLGLEFGLGLELE